MDETATHVIEPLSDETIFGVPADMLPQQQQSENICMIRGVVCSAWENCECRLQEGCLYDI